MIDGNENGGFGENPKLDFNEVDDSSCRALWAAVLVQACIDARTQSKKRENIKIRAEALAWLAQAEDDSDFIMVCEMADLEPSVIRKNLRKFLRHDGGLNFHCVRKSRPQLGRRKKALQPTKKGDNYEQRIKNENRWQQQSKCG